MFKREQINAFWGVSDKKVKLGNKDVLKLIKFEF